MESSSESVLGKGEWETAFRDFLPLDKNNSDPTPPITWSPRQSVSDPVTAPISAVTLSQWLPDAAWPGVAVVIRIARLMLNWADGLIWLQGYNNK